LHKKLVIKPSVILSTSIVVLVCALLGLVLLNSIPLPSVACAQDVGILLDAGWRSYQGQICHVDYKSPLGPVFAIMPGIFFLLLGPCYSSLALLPWVISCLVAIWTWALVWNKAYFPVGVAATITISLFAGGLFHPGFDYKALGFAVFYNRVGFGLLSVAAIAALLPRQEKFTRASLFADASLGAAMTILVFLKASLFIFAVGPMVLSLLLIRRSPQEYLALAAGILTTFLICGASIGFRLDLMLSDLLMAASARSQVMASHYFFPIRNLMANADFILLAVFISIPLLIEIFRKDDMARAAAKGLLIYWMLLFLGFCVTLTQSHGDGRGIPTIIAGGLVMITWIKEIKLVRAAVINTVTCGVLIQTFLLAWPHVMSYRFLWSLSPNDFTQEFRQPSLKDWHISDFNLLGNQFAPLVNEGAELVARNTSKSASLVYPDYANVFNFTLGMRSPKGSMLWWDTAATYSRKRHPPTNIFDDTEYLLIPITRSVLPLNDFFSIYGTYIQIAFREVARSENFLLLRRTVSHN